jgi:hypothetical protein
MAMVWGAGLAVLAFHSRANAEWPQARHDARRSATADGVSNIQEPVAYWRHFAGGTLRSDGALMTDVDSNGDPELLVVSGGKASLRDPETGDRLWESANLELDRLVAVADLDGDAIAEIVVRSTRRVFVLRMLDGQVHWAEPIGQMGTIGNVRLADYDADGELDVLIQECGCCSVNSGRFGFVYSFSGPGTSIALPELLWELPTIACGPGRPGTVVRMRSSNQIEFVNAVNNSALELLDGATGSSVAPIPTFAPNSVTSTCRAIDVPISGGEELLCVFNLSQNPPGQGHRVMLFDYQGGAVVTAWDQSVGEVDGSVEIPPGMIADLDGDAVPEVSVSARLNDGTWVAYVLDSVTGGARAELVGQRVAGTLQIELGSSLLLTREDDQLAAWTLGTGGAVPAWSLPGRSVMSMVDLPLSGRTLINQRLVAVDVNGNGTADLVTTDVDTGGDIRGFEVSSGTPVEVAEYALPSNTAALTAWAFGSDADARLTLMQSDGNLHLLEGNWQPVTGNPKFGVRVAGFYAPGTWRLLRGTPVAAQIDDGGPPGVFVHTSRGALERIDATEATFAVGPTRAWDRRRTVASVVTTESDGTRGIIAIDVPAGDRHGVVALTTQGETRWTHELQGLTLTDLVLARLDGDDFDDVIVQWGLSSDQVERNTALSGATGAVLWDAPPLGPYNRQPAGGAAVDWNGDGVDDFVHQAEVTIIRDGVTGAQLAASAPASGHSYYMPIVDDVDGDGEDEFTLHGGFAPAFTLETDLQSTLWQGTEDDRPLTYATIVRCDSEPPLLVGGSWQFPSRLKVTEVAGQGAGSYETLVLANGELFATETEATQAGAVGGQLGSPTAHLDLAGDGRVKVLVGSTDGWLYGLDICARTLAFALPFGAPVGVAVYGDSDADGLDEILVSVADGYLYGLKESLVPAPELVIDTDPPHGFLDEDVDTIETFDTLYAAWTAVAGADGYELSVVRDPVDGGGFITGGWVDMGDTTRATVESLPLEDGERYFVAVRARADGELSPDVLSDGVRVVIVDAPPEDEAPGEAGSGPVWLVGRSCVYFCAIPSRTPAGPALWVIVAVGVLVGRRRLRRR